MTIRIFGWIAGGFGIVYNLPQIYRLWKRKTAGDISSLALIVRIIAYICYIVHSIFIKDPPLFWMTFVSLMQCFVLGIQLIYYNMIKGATLSLEINNEPE